MRRLAGLATLALALGGCGSAPAHPPSARHPPRAGRAVSQAPAPAVVLGAHPLRGAAARHAEVPVLMYHVIAEAPAGTPYPELWVAPARFAEHIAALRRAGYRAVSLQRVLDAWAGGVALPAHPLVVSFDDGYPSQYRAAFPVLRRAGWTGVLNLEVNDVGPAGIHPAEVRALLRAGWEVDSHTVTHPDLTKLDDAALRHELVASRARLRRRFGRRIAALLCYPSGRYDARVERAVRAAGYAAATTTQPGWATPRADRFALPRVRVNGTDSAATVLAAVTAARSG